jgi:nucleoside 2-deoxyribosyltransferase
MSDNLLLLIDERVEGRPGRPISIIYNSDPPLVASIGAVDQEDVLWAIRNLEEKKLLEGTWTTHFSGGHLTAAGWERVEELKRAHVASRYAFFARKFTNDDLDALYKNCLRQAVSETGFDLRIVTQKAGHIDAIIEDEIRRCRFLIADLSDDNAGAYWEAGFAEGLGKDVIYICREKEKDGKTDKKTHFDTDHRQTVRWDLTKPDETAARLKAVIRNTLLGDAKQED